MNEMAFAFIVLKKGIYFWGIYRFVLLLNSIMIASLKIMVIAHRISAAILCP